MRTAKAQISLRIHAVRSGSLSAINRITGSSRMYEWRAKARMIFCACAGWSESARYSKELGQYFCIYCINSLPNLSTIWTSPFVCPLMRLKHCWMSDKQCRPWSDGAYCAVWSGSKLIAQYVRTHRVNTEFIEFHGLPFHSLMTLFYNFMSVELCLEACVTWFWTQVFMPFSLSYMARIETIRSILCDSICFFPSHVFVHVSIHTIVTSYQLYLQFVFRT